MSSSSDDERMNHSAADDSFQQQHQQQQHHSDDNDDDSADNNHDEINGTSTRRRPRSTTDTPPDGDTLRVMISTDNHLGYCERDPVRGLDSFAAFEEVLWLARKKQCDMVLMAGDLFHDNKPSRTTLHKTMDIIRRYTMGPDPVQIQIVSDQVQNFNRSLHGKVNYEDEYYSVDLPLFSIHGNHDDPTRDGVGTGNMLAALDLLSVSNLVNYFGRQDQVDKVEISPVLLQKGTTKVALYGMGSMRDERLNRMWTGKKVRFLRPEQPSQSEDDDDDNNDGEDDDDNTKNNEWFNIFALHQNRDFGRGVKNCVHESMIPEWMDLIVWGHEHECNIEPTESVVGTFRITQPGSSVATSLTSGEAVKKQVGILEIRNNQFRLEPVPLTQVRSFVMGELSLNNYTPESNNGDDPLLDPEDLNIDKKVSALLEEEVQILIHEAREKTKELHIDAQRRGNTILLQKDLNDSYGDDDDDDDDGHTNGGIKFKIEKPKEVLVRLKVEHTGFTTLNNQRFGAKFVGNVANPTDILLFHRRRAAFDKDGNGASHKKKKKKGTAGNPLEDPMDPEDLEEMNVEDLVKGMLEKAERKLDLINEDRLGLALEDFVSKEQKQALKENFSNDLKKQQRTLINRANETDATEAGEDNNGGELTTAASSPPVDMKESLAAATRKARKRRAGTDSPGEIENAKENSLLENEDEDDDLEEPVPAPKRKRATPTSRSSTTKTQSSRTSRSSASTATTTAKRRRNAAPSDDDSDDVLEITTAATQRRTASSSQRSTAPSRSSPRRRIARSKPNYSYTEDSDDNDNNNKNQSSNRRGDDSDAIVEIDDSDEDNDFEVVLEKPKKKQGRQAAASKSRASSTRTKRTSVASPFSQAASQAMGSTPSSQKRQTQSQLSFFTVSKTSTKPKRATGTGRATRNTRRASNYDESSDEDCNSKKGRGDNVDNVMSAGWGTAATPSMNSQRRSRRR